MWMEGADRITRDGLAQHLKSTEHSGGIIACPERRFIYMKPAKTAGTSILRGGLERRVNGVLHSKSDPDRFRQWLTELNDDVLDEYFIFSVVRSPFDRLVSVSAHFGIPFTDFVHRMDEHFKSERVRGHAAPLHRYTHLNGRPFVNCICRFESLQPDLNLVFDRLEIPRFDLPVLNKSTHEHFAEYYSPQEVSVVGEAYAEDLRLFGYSFPPELVEGLNLRTRKSPRRRVLRRVLRKFVPGQRGRHRAGPNDG